SGYHSSALQALRSTPVESIDPLIPFRILKGQEEKLLAQMKTLRAEYGFRRFTLLGPSKAIRYSGFPDAEVYRALGEQVLFFKEQLAAHDIVVGWESESTIK